MPAPPKPMWILWPLALAAALLPFACAEPAPQVITERDRASQQVEQVRLSRVIRESEGSVSRGSDLFASRCGNCHALHGVGAGEPPAGDLADYPRSEEDIPQFLELVGFPNSDDHPYHTLYEAHTRDGDSVSGVLSARDDEHMTIMTVAGRESTIPHDRLRHLRPAYTTIVPGHLLTAMTDQQIVDLFTFVLADAADVESLDEDLPAE